LFAEAGTLHASLLTPDVAPEVSCYKRMGIVGTESEYSWRSMVLRSVVERNWPCKKDTSALCTASIDNDSLCKTGWLPMVPVDRYIYETLVIGYYCACGEGRWRGVEWWHSTMP
jgi:hypothetical protein